MSESFDAEFSGIDGEGLFDVVDQSTIVQRDERLANMSVPGNELTDR